MLNTSDLPFASSAPEEVPAEIVKHSGPPALVAGSVTAQTLHRVWSGDPVVIVDSPPGAGKTLLATTVVSQLVSRTDLDVCVATATRRQAFDLARRLISYMPAERIHVCMSNAEASDVPEGVQLTGARKVEIPPHSVRIRTVASCTLNPDGYDLMVIDEAYQLTFASVASAAALSDQVVLIGDPGQIGPVVTCDTTAWQGRKMAPHLRAPEVFRRRADATVLNLDTSWRLGPETVEAIAPLYGFEFTSSRPARTLEGHNEIESVQVPPASSPYDQTLLETVADLAVSFVGSEVLEGHEVTIVDDVDVAVVLSHNAQVSTVGAMLRSRGYGGITVGTADRLQGGQWQAVVAVDPLCGHEGVSPHSLSPGRLCVMASRHMTHMTWVHDGRWVDQLEEPEVGKSAGRVGRSVREALCR